MTGPSASGSENGNSHFEDISARAVERLQDAFACAADRDRRR